MTRSLPQSRAACARRGQDSTVIEPRVHLIPGRSADGAPIHGHFNVLRGYVAPLRLAGVKVVGDFVDNYELGLPSEMGLLTLFDPATGAPGRGDRRRGTHRHAHRCGHGARRAGTSPGVTPRAGAHRRPRHGVLERAPARSAVRLRRDPHPLPPRREPRTHLPRGWRSDLGKTVTATTDWESLRPRRRHRRRGLASARPEPLLKTEWIKRAHWSCPMAR